MRIFSRPQWMQLYAIISDASEAQWYQYKDPTRVVVASTPDQVINVIDTMEKWVDDEQGWAVGYIAYEAAPAFDTSLPVLLDRRRRPPLAVFGLFQSRERIELDTVKPELHKWSIDSTRAEYDAHLKSLHEQILAGDFYQVNYSARCRADMTSGYELFRQIGAGAPYGAYLDLPDQGFEIACASPELFFSRQGNSITSKPMKGTAARGHTPAADKAAAEWLSSSEKNRAENLMIVDMVRNDLSRIAQIGSVTAAELFTLEAYPTVWQMTSTVSAATQASLSQIFSALFPAASITGAPKKASMEFIASRERTSRSIYTGSVGVVGPNKTAQFNVAIRTALIDTAAQRAVFGVGGGIVADSTVEEEYAEVVSKTKLLSTHQEEFSLLETMRLMEGEIYLVHRHVQRVWDSAQHFGFGLEKDRLLQQLADLCQQNPEGIKRVRMLVDRLGGIVFEVLPMPEVESGQDRGSQTMTLANCAIDTQGVSFRHKTTRRRTYERLAAQCPDREVVLYNLQGFITETTIANIVYEQAGERFTPPLSDGLLPGTLREELLAAGEITERSLHQAEIADVDAWYLINALRGWRDASF